MVAISMKYCTDYFSKSKFSVPDNGRQKCRDTNANDPGFRSLDSSMKDRHVGWKNLKSKFCYLEAVSEELIKIIRFMNI